MQHFTLISSGIDVAPINAILAANPQLWDQHNYRRVGIGTPHNEMRDIWLRYNDYNRLKLGNEIFNGEHVPVWYPAWRVLEPLHQIIFDLMTKVQGEMIGMVLITTIPPGGKIAPHTDNSWHVQYFEKFYLSLESSPGAEFVCQDGEVREALEPAPGEIYLFDNRKLHWVNNNSQYPRTTAIICIRTEMFGRV